MDAQLNKTTHNLMKYKPFTMLAFLAAATLSQAEVTDYRFQVEVLAKGRVLGVELNARRKEPNPRKLVLVVPEEDV